MTEEDREQIKRLWENGVGKTKIPYLVPCQKKETKDYIQEKLADGTFSADRHIQKVRLIRDAYRKGITNPYELAEKFCTTLSVVKGALSVFNRTRPAHNYKPRKAQILCPKTQKILNDIKEKVPTRKICAEYGITRQYVNSLKHKYVEKEK